MIEQGIVTKTEKNTAVVKVEKRDECSKCGMCLFPKGASSIDFNVVNKVGASEGDTVIIDTQNDGKLLGAILVFLVPLLLIGVSALIGFLVIQWELSVLILSVVLIALWFVILSIIEKKLKKTAGFTPVIIQIINKGEKQ